MAAGAVVIWLFVIGCAVYATRIRPAAHEDFAGTAFIVGGGVVLPVVVLSALLIYSFLLAREPAAIAGDGLRIEVIGKQWWWEVRYFPPGADAAGDRPRTRCGCRPANRSRWRCARPT